jgi:crossover junction endodeoxyribonuclease RuvC
VRVLGIDPGYGILGWSAIDDRLKIHGYGVITTPAGESLDLRLLNIHNALHEIIREFSPDVVAVEKLFFNKNTKTVINVAMAIGVIMLTVRLSGAELAEYTPTQVKQAITGYGRATKQQVQVMIKKIFNIRELPKPDDAADALAIALSHALRAKSESSTYLAEG